MEKNITRYQWLDIAKGIAILLMVIGHTSIPDPINRFIFAFHMPLFFIASGYCTNWSKLTYADFVLHKCKTLLVPFVIYSAIVLIIGVSINQMDAMLIITQGWASNCYPLWFVPILFVGLLLAKAIMSIQNGKLRIIVWILMALIGSFLKYKLIYLPYTLSPAFYASFLLIAGTYAKSLQTYILNPKWWVLSICFVITAIISHFWKVNMSWNTINPVVFITIGAFAGTYLIFGTSALIERFCKKAQQVLVFFGKETYVLLAFSSIIPSVLTTYVKVNGGGIYVITFLILIIIINMKNCLNKLLGYKIL